MEVTHFELKRRYIRERIASIQQTMRFLMNSLEELYDRMNERMLGNNLTNNQMMHLLDISLEAGLKIATATADMEYICIKHIDDYIQINSDEIIHLELALISL